MVILKIMITNPKTGRKVKKDSKLGKALLVEYPDLVNNNDNSNDNNKKANNIKPEKMVILKKTANSTIYVPESAMFYSPPMFLFFRHTYHGLFYDIMNNQPTCDIMRETFYGPLIRVSDEQEFKKKLLKGDYDDICVTNRLPPGDLYHKIGYKFDSSNKNLEYLKQDFSYFGRTIGFIREKYGLKSYDDEMNSGNYDFEIDYAKLIKIERDNDSF